MESPMYFIFGLMLPLRKSHNLQPLYFHSIFNKCTVWGKIPFHLDLYHTKQDDSNKKINYTFHYQMCYTCKTLNELCRKRKSPKWRQNEGKAWLHLSNSFPPFHKHFFSDKDKNACPVGTEPKSCPGLSRLRWITITNMKVVLTGIRQNAELHIVNGISRPFPTQCWRQIHS